MIRSLPPVLALVAGSATLATAQEPLVPGPRWTHPAPAAQAWIPDSVSFAGRGDLVVAAARGASPRLISLDAAAPAWPAARAVELDVGGGEGTLQLLGGPDAERSFALVQPVTASAGWRRTEVRAVDPTRDLALEWVHDAGVLTRSGARLAVDGDGAVLVLAVHDEVAGRVQVDRLDAVSGLRLSRTWLDGPNVADLDLSSDGRRAVLLSGDRLYLLGEDGALLQTEHLAAPARCVSLDADGDTLAVGGEHQLAVLREGVRGYVPTTSLYPGSSTWFALVADLSPAGDAVAVGWWDTATGRSVRYELWELAPLARTFERRQVSGTLQHLPTAAVFSADGRRVAFGGWGADAEPEALWLDRESAQLLMEIDLPGSVRALALDGRGERLAVAHKDAHANQAATTGAVRLLASGEAELELLAAPAPAGTLELAARHPGQGFVLFLVGRSAEPVLLPGAGSLGLDRATLTVHPRLADPEGRADLALALPADPNLVGTRIAVQAAFREAGALSLGANVVEPLVLD